MPKFFAVFIRLYFGTHLGPRSLFRHSHTPQDTTGHHGPRAWPRRRYRRWRKKRSRGTGECRGAASEAVCLDLDPWIQFDPMKSMEFYACLFFHEIHKRCIDVHSGYVRGRCWWIRRMYIISMYKIAMQARYRQKVQILSMVNMVLSACSQVLPLKRRGGVSTNPDQWNGEVCWREWNWLNN